MATPLFAASGGPADGTALLLVHPMGADHSFWDDCRKIWGDRFRCIAVELRGAGRSPALAAALVLSNPGYRTKPEARAALADRAAKARSEGIGAVAEAVDRSFLGHSDPERVEIYRKRFLQQDAAAYALQIEGMLEADVSMDLRRISCPTLVMAGGRDVLLPVDHAQQIVAALPRGELHIVEAAGHFIPFQYPELFARSVAEFLAQAT